MNWLIFENKSIMVKVVINLAIRYAKDCKQLMM